MTAGDAVAHGESGVYGKNRADGVIEDRIYLGVEYRLVVRIPGDVRIQVRSRELTNLSAFNPGVRVRLTWSDVDVVIISERAGL